MTNNMQSFFSSLKIQSRVVYALMLREIITRYGRHNLGFAWLFVEPMIFTLGVSVLWSVAKVTHGSSIAIIPFAVIGYSTVLLWRNIANKVAHAVRANTGLLYHRNVTVLDVFLARIFLEMLGATFSFMALSLFFIFIGEMQFPVDFLMMVEGWFLLAWFATALGLIIGSLFEISEVIEKVWHPFTYILFPMSGAGFFVAWLPTPVQKFVLYIPMVHYSEMIRHGYYGEVIQTYESLSYMLWSNVIFMFVGLYLVRYIRYKIEVSS